MTQLTPRSTVTSPLAVPQSCGAYESGIQSDNSQFIFELENMSYIEYVQFVGESDDGFNTNLPYSSQMNWPLGDEN